MDTNEETNLTSGFDFDSIIQGFQEAAQDEAPAAPAPLSEEADLSEVFEALVTQQLAAEPVSEEPAVLPDIPEMPETAEETKVLPSVPAAAPAPVEDSTLVFTPAPAVPQDAPEEKPDSDTSELTSMLQGLLAPEEAGVPAAEQAAPAEPAPAADSEPVQETPKTTASVSDATVIRPAAKAATKELPKTASAPKSSPVRKTGPIPLLRSERLRELKRKLVAGPEKRYYELSESGVTRMQLGILINAVFLLIAAALVIMHYLRVIPIDRMKLTIFSQVLLMLLSGLVGCQVMIDGIGDLLRLRFSLNTSLCISFLACIGDAWFCLDELRLSDPKTIRLPCCCVFILVMEMALLARYQKHSTEIAQMDSLRKASNLTGLVREPDVYGKRAGILRTDGDVEDFMDNYRKTPGPEMLLRIYAAVAFIISLGIAVIAGLLYSPSLAVQVFSNAMLASVPACAYISVSRPAAILAKRLHMVGSVICGWNGVKKLSRRGAFLLSDSDFFPRGSTKLNGIKFCSERTPAEVVSYSASLVFEAGGNLVAVFRTLMSGRNGVEYPVEQFRDYGIGGIGGIVNGETVLVGSVSFLREMGIEVPEESIVEQALYIAIENQLAAVVAVSYAKMRSVSAGIVSLNGCGRLRSVANTKDFNLTESFLREKFSIRSRRMVFPTEQEREALNQIQPSDDAEVLALVSRDDLISFVYPVTGSMALRGAAKAAAFISFLGGFLGILIMGALAYLGQNELLVPVNLLIYQMIWLVPAFLATECARRV